MRQVELPDETVPVLDFFASKKLREPPESDPIYILLVESGKRKKRREKQYFVPVGLWVFVRLALPLRQELRRGALFAVL